MQYPGEDDVCINFCLGLNCFILVCCILACLLNIVCWIVQHLLLFTYDNASQRITMPLHSPGLRICTSHLLWLHASCHRRWTDPLYFVPDWWIPLLLCSLTCTVWHRHTSCLRTGNLTYCFAFLCPFMWSAVHLRMSFLNSAGTVRKSPQTKSSLEGRPHLSAGRRRCRRYILRLAIFLVMQCE